MDNHDYIVKATSDVFIKYLFGRETEISNDLLISFVNAVLEDSHFPRITKVIQKNPFNYQEFKNDKLSILDIVVEDENSRIFNIEVQSSGDFEFRHRSLYYWAKLYVSQIEKGDEYEKLKPAVGINIVDFELFENLRNFHNCFVIKDMEGNRILTDHLTIHFLELHKIPEGTKGSKIVNWLLYFISEGKDNKTMETLIKDDDDIKKAHDEYEKFNRNKDLRILAISREKAYRDKLYHERIAREKGHREGHLEGREEGREEGRAEALAERLEKEQEILIALMESKFGKKEKTSEIIMNQTDPLVLDKAIKHIITAKKAEEILSILTN